MYHWREEVVTVSTSCSLLREHPCWTLDSDGRQAPAFVVRHLKPTVTVDEWCFPLDSKHKTTRDIKVSSTLSPNQPDPLHRGAMLHALLSQHTSKENDTCQSFSYKGDHDPSWSCLLVWTQLGLTLGQLCAPSIQPTMSRSHLVYSSINSVRLSPDPEKTRASLLCGIWQPLGTVVGDLVLVRISVAVVKHHGQKATSGGKGSFGLNFHITLHH